MHGELADGAAGNGLRHLEGGAPGADVEPAVGEGPVSAMAMRRKARISCTIRSESSEPSSAMRKIDRLCDLLVNDTVYAFLFCDHTLGSLVTYTLPVVLALSVLLAPSTQVAIVLLPALLA